MRVRFRPRLCKNARNFDANGTAHHIGSAGVQASVLMPTLTRHALKFGPQLPPTFTKLSFYTASARSGQAGLAAQSPRRCKAGALAWQTVGMAATDEQKESQRRPSDV